MEFHGRRALIEALGYVFADESLLHEALVHKSYAHERPKLAPRHNERLEFLGDAILGAATAELLFRRFPDVSEGRLTRLRAGLVRESTLAEVARELGLRPLLLLGKGEDRSGGRDKPRLLASVFEAVLGAVFLDSSFDVAAGVVERLFEPRIDAVAAQPKDPKSRVQEFLQARGRPTPSYRVVETRGADHDREFEVELLLEGRGVATGVGRSKLEAERAAALAALSELTARAAV